MRRVLALLLVLSAAPVTAGDAARPRISGRIVFASERGSTLDNSEIHSVRSNGSGRRALSRNLGLNEAARWSPDGSRIAFTAERSERGRPVNGLYLMEADGRRQRRLTPRGFDGLTESGAPSWSPDGMRIAFAGERRSRQGVWTIRADGTQLRLLARRGFTPVWSPSGDRIAFSGAGIHVISASGGAARRLTRHGGDGEPAWSPDGRTIAFVHSNGSFEELDVVPASDGRLRRIFGGRRGVSIGRAPRWSPSGRRLLFEANTSVYVARVRDRAVVRLRRGDWPAWSPDERGIAFTLGSTIYVMNADGSRVRRVRTERGAEFSEGPEWSPDGTTLVYSTTLARSDFEIFVARADGSGLRQLTRNSVQDWMPAWSPARRRIAFVRRGWIWLMSADGTTERRLFAGSQPSWSPDGSQLAYAAGGVNIRKISGGKPTHVADGYSPAWSPSGAELAFVRGTLLLGLDLRTGTERTLVDVASSCTPGEETSVGGPDWSPDGRQLVFAVSCDDGRFVSTSAEVVAADGSGRRRLPLDDLDSTRLAWSPDGARVAFMTEDPTRRVATARLDGSGLTAVVRTDEGAAYLDPDW